MIPPNINCFNILALYIFQEMYDSFPQPLDITLLDLAEKCYQKNPSLGNEQDFIKIVESSVDWLKSEGFIKFERLQRNDSPSGTIFQAQLTLKSLTVLGFLPSVIKGKAKRETIIDRIKKILSSSAESAGEDAVKGVLLEIFGRVLGFAASSGL